MEELKLGPNGGMMYCMEFLEKNFDWFEEKLKSLGGNFLYLNKYFTNRISNFFFFNNKQIFFRQLYII
jgi:hypothetical protein